MLRNLGGPNWHDIFEFGLTTGLFVSRSSVQALHNAWIAPGVSLDSILPILEQYKALCATLE